MTNALSLSKYLYWPSWMKNHSLFYNKTLKIEIYFQIKPLYRTVHKQGLDSSVGRAVHSAVEQCHKGPRWESVCESLLNNSTVQITGQLYYTVFISFYQIYKFNPFLNQLGLESLAPHHGGFESQQGLDSFMWRSYPAILRNIGGSTQVPACAWNNAQRSTWGLPPPVKLESRHITVLVRH